MRRQAENDVRDNAATMSSPISRPLRLDLAVYVGFAAFALITALASGYRTHSVWGAFATAGYLLAACHTVFLLVTRRASSRWWDSRWTSAGLAFVLALVAPLAVLLVARLSGGDWADSPAAWAAQPEVWVIERSGLLLLETGTPYVDVFSLGRAPEVNDYTPYGPAMALFGLPRALATQLGIADVGLVQVLTDARLWFLAVAALCVWLSLRLLDKPSVPIAAAQIAVLCPATAMTFAVAAPDLAVIGLLILSLTLAVRAKHVLAGVLLAVVVSAKLTAAPALVVLFVLIVARGGWACAGRFTAAFVGAAAVLHVPALVDPAAFVEHVLAFPAGRGAVPSPAASPLPGHLIAETGPIGHAIALGLLATAAVAIGLWVVVRPPRTGADAALRLAVGLGAAIMLTPATRWGYVVYPLALLGARWCFPQEEGALRRARSTSSSG
jgi:hypothetical protein